MTATVPTVSFIGAADLMINETDPDFLLQHVGDAMRAADMQKRLTEIGAVAQGSTPAEFAATLARERERWGKLIREKGIRAE